MMEAEYSGMSETYIVFEVLFPVIAGYPQIVLNYTIS